MEQLLTTYLYQYKICPLPKLGTLILQPGSAVAQQADKLMQAPVPAVEFSSNESNAEGLLQYIAAVLKIDQTAASLTLDNFCRKIATLGKNESLNFSHAGSFRTDEAGRLYFEAIKPSSSFLQEVIAERVIHPDAKHNMLVGDTHTNTGIMTELLFAEEKKRRNSWIWWAIGLAAVAAIAIIFYYTNQSSTGFGNGNSVTPTQQPASTYSTGSK